MAALLAHVATLATSDPIVLNDLFLVHRLFLFVVVECTVLRYAHEGAAGFA